MLRRSTSMALGSSGIIQEAHVRGVRDHSFGVQGGGG